MILFTSGTTGPSKGAVLSHRANVSVASSTCALMGYGEDEVLFNMFPLYHVNARYTSVLPSMWLDRAHLRAPRPLLGLTLLGHLPRRGRDRVQLHGRPRADALQAARAGRRRRQPGALRLRGARARRRARALRAALRRRARSRSTDRRSSAPASRTAAASAGSAPAGSRRRTTSSRSTTRTTTRSARASRARSWCAPASRTSWWRSTSERPRRAWRRSGTSGSTRATAAARTRTAGSTTSTGSRTRSAGAARTSRRGRSSRSSTTTRRWPSRPRSGSRPISPRRRSWSSSCSRKAPSSLPRQLLDFCQERLPHFAVPRYVRFVDELPKNHAQRIQKPELRAEAVTADTWDREQHGYVVTR